MLPAPHLIDVADFFIDLGEIAELVSKDGASGGEYVPDFIPPNDSDKESKVSAENKNSTAREDS